MLSSTASLVRPVGRIGSGSRSKTATVAVGLPGIGKGDYKSAVVSGNGNSGSEGVGTNGVRGIVKKKSSLGVVNEEGGGGVSARGQAKIMSPGLVPTPIAAAGKDTSLKRDEDASTRDTAFGQARLRDLIKKYQGGNA